LDTGDWAHVKLAFCEKTQTLKGQPLIPIISILNVSEPVGFGFIESAHLESDLHLRYLIFDQIRMLYCILKFFLKLKISNIQSIKVIIEVKARMHFIYFGNLIFFLDGGLLNFFLLHSISYHLI